MFLNYNSNEFNIQNIQFLHTTSYISQDKNLSIYLDNSNTDSIVNRENGIYKVYDNLFLNQGKVLNSQDIKEKMIDKFIFNLSEILEDLDDNNVLTIFNLYFLVKPDFDRFIKFDIENLNKHFSKYPPVFINQNIIKIYKNTGLLAAFGVSESLFPYDFYELTVISSEIKKTIIENIKFINKNVDKDFNNTIINYTNKFDIKSEIMLIIHADFYKIDRSH